MPTDSGRESMMDAILKGDKPNFYVSGDITPFISPITREEISTRSAKRDHLKRHEVVEIGNEKPDWMKKQDDLAKAKSQ